MSSADYGKSERMKILVRDAEQALLTPLRTHLWNATIECEDQNGEFLIIRAERSGAAHRVALLYSSATGNAVYRQLDGQVEHIYTRGELYKIESFAYGITTQVAPVSTFHALLLQWNAAVSEGKFAPAPAVAVTRTRREYELIQSEAPLEQIWSRLNHFGSVTLAERLVSNRAEREGAKLSSEVIKSKASGLAYAIRNASDYYRRMPGQNVSQRVLNLYYGTLAFAFADMLASPSGPKTLGEIEDFTKQGHGLYTLDGANESFADLTVGALASGFFPRWARFLGHDTSAYPTKKPKNSTELTPALAPFTATLSDLYGRVPELFDLYLDVFDRPPLWLQPIYDSNANDRDASGRVTAKQTYILLVDSSGRFPLNAAASIAGPLSQIHQIEHKEAGNWYRALVDHRELDHWARPLKIHSSPFIRGAMIVPLFGDVVDFRAIFLVLLYGLSILVRYRPSVWRRVQEGDWDQYKVLSESLLNVGERVLPEKFLQSIVGRPLHAKQPGEW